MAHEQQQPMSDARLEEIREHATHVLRNPLNHLGQEVDMAERDRRDLLAEVEHLRREVAACEREITREGQRVADARDDVMRAEQALALAEHRHAKREAALVEVARAVAFDDPIQPDSGNFVCYYCCACAPYESAVVHGEHCTYEQARALLASDSQS